jgi:MSHA biogenesis protein MshK
MAEYLNNAAKRLAIRGTAACAFLMVVVPVAAQALVDPTRPPASLNTEPMNSGQPMPAGPVLQSVLISPRRKEAIISGQTVKIGDKVGEAKVVRIAEGQVVLRNGTDLQTLKLFPNIEKRSTPSRAGSKSDNRRP